MAERSASIDGAVQGIESLIDGLDKVLKGKREFLKRLVAAFIAGGHVLIQDVPGLGKTTVAKTLAKLISSQESPVSYKRIQFTPDLLPYDITGVDVYDPDSRSFDFVPGPIFADVVLADEINRSTPKVQSALLEVMAEGQVTVGNRTHLMGDLFFVIATQNPIEIEGTYPLPVAQSDRFLVRLSLGYPDEADELAILKEDPSHTVMPYIEAVCGRNDVLELRRVARELYCDDVLLQAVVKIANHTRNDDQVAYGASPRAGLMLVAAARAFALVQGRDYVIDQDIVELAPLVLAHRIKMHDTRLTGADVERYVEKITRIYTDAIHRG